jgi:hypothetical protein
MLWYKSWLDTRWRFLLALVLLLVFACGTVMSFETMQKLLASLPQDAFKDALPGGDTVQQQIRESLDAARTFSGYVWSQWLAQPRASDARRGAARQRQPAREVRQRRAVLAGAAGIA